MSLHHYSFDVTVTDALLNQADSTRRARFTAAALAWTEEDARNLAQDFYSRSGFAIKTVNGIQTLFRSAPSNMSGSIRTVLVSNINLIPAPEAEAALPVQQVDAPAPATRKRGPSKAAQKAAAEKEPLVEQDAPVEEPAE